jgi:hypothetical protein
VIAVGDLGMRSLLGMWECDSEALLQAVRCLGCWDAIAFGVGSAIAKRCCKQFAFGGCWECDRLLGVFGGAIAFGNVGMRSLVEDVEGVRSLLGSAIAKRCCKQFAV